MFKTNNEPKDLFLSGSIGYTFLNDNNKKILILSDMHSKMPYCNNGMFISEWLKTKKTSKVLLEEVPRLGSKLKELWPSSPHTQKLKEMYLNNSTVINGVDIRPFLIPYSWELIFEKYELPDINLKEYLEYIDNFFQLKHNFFINDLKLVYTKNFLDNSKLGEHFFKMKNNVEEYVKENKNVLGKKVKILINTNNPIIFEKINDIISNIMEWYIIAKIFNENTNNNFIVHAGLLHTSNINKLLLTHYKFKLTNFDGIYSIDDVNKENTKGCLILPTVIDKQLGGYLSGYLKKLKIL